MREKNLLVHCLVRSDNFLKVKKKMWCNSFFFFRLPLSLVLVMTCGRHQWLCVRVSTHLVLASCLFEVFRSSFCKNSCATFFPFFLCVCCGLLVVRLATSFTMFRDVSYSHYLWCCFIFCQMGVGSVQVVHCLGQISFFFSVQNRFCVWFHSFYFSNRGFCK